MGCILSSRLWYSAGCKLEHSRKIPAGQTYHMVISGARRRSLASDASASRPRARTRVRSPTRTPLFRAEIDAPGASASGGRRRTGPDLHLLLIGPPAICSLSHSSRLVSRSLSPVFSRKPAWGLWSEFENGVEFSEARRCSGPLLALLRRLLFPSRDRLRRPR